MEVGQLICDANELVGFCNCLMVNSEILLGRDSFSCGDRSAGKQCRLIDWFLYGAPYIIEDFLKNLSESFIDNLNS